MADLLVRYGNGPRGAKPSGDPIVARGRHPPAWELSNARVGARRHTPAVHATRSPLEAEGRQPVPDRRHRNQMLTHLDGARGLAVAAAVPRVSRPLLCRGVWVGRGLVSRTQEPDQKPWL